MVAYDSAFIRADEVGAESIAFPSISTGVCDYPGELAAMRSVEALRTVTTNLKRCILLAHSVDTVNMWDYELYDRW